MRFSHRIASLAAAAVTVFASTAFAAVVTTPVGVYTNTGSSNMGDTIAADAWLRVNVRNGGQVGISTTYPRNGDGSVFMSLGDNTNNNAKADWEYYPTAGFGRLADLTALSYDWYRDAASTTGTNFHPVIRLFIDADGDSTTTTDRGYLVFERSYNPNVSPVPTNIWTNETITGATNLWWVQFGFGIEPVYNRTLSTYQAGTYTPSSISLLSFAQIGPNSTILGVSLGIGSGWNTGVSGGPAFLGAVDNVTLTSITSGAASLSQTNFEVRLPVAVVPAAPVPTLNIASLLALVALFVLGLGWFSRRRFGTGAPR
ncbi:MAG: hypothetical protein EAZ43_08125 [Betaproteobacteria bacterium]|nr:MAG: hypothetical protein EAZ43_08125 [Betaproteobacteria bacterium]